MEKILLNQKNSFVKFLFVIVFFTSVFISRNSLAVPGDTTWVTTFNQTFQNWADIHYGTFVLPDTTTHYTQILMFYTIGCPAAGCDPWDRLGWIKLYKDTLTNYEIARVITPYNIVGSGYPGQCVFIIDVTDYMPILHDTVRLGSYIESWIGGTRGWLVTVRLAYIEGEIQYKPFKVINLWQNSHVIYGDPADPPESHLQPITTMIDPIITKAKVRVTTTGHGQGNTDNAAEFSYKQHTVIVGNDTTSHYLWRSDCPTNPCSPQGGTWPYPRAGWCPGSGVIPWDVDATNSVTPGQNATIRYNIEPYENFCRLNNPNCISGQTCADCNYNNNGHTEPHYTIQGQLILYKINPFASIKIISTEVPPSFKLEQNYPNPFNPSTKIKFDIAMSSLVKLSIYDIQGKLIKTLVSGQLTPGSYSTEWNAADYPSGIYIYRLVVTPSTRGNPLEAERFSETKRMMLVK